MTMFGQKGREFHHCSELTVPSRLYSTALCCRLPLEVPAQRGPRALWSQPEHPQRSSSSSVLTGLPATDEPACPEVPALVTGQPTDVDSPEHPCCAAWGADPAGQTTTQAQGQRVLGSEDAQQGAAWHRQPTRPWIPHPMGRPARLPENKQTPEVIDGSLWKTLITWL